MARICGFVMGATAEELTWRQVPVIQSGISSDFPLEFQPPCTVTCGQRTSAEGCDSQVTEARQGPRTWSSWPLPFNLGSDQLSWSPCCLLQLGSPGSRDDPVGPVSKAPDNSSFHKPPAD